MSLHCSADQLLSLHSSSLTANALQAPLGPLPGSFHGRPPCTLQDTTPPELPCRLERSTSKATAPEPCVSRRCPQLSSLLLQRPSMLLHRPAGSLGSIALSDVRTALLLGSTGQSASCTIRRLVQGASEQQETQVVMYSRSSSLNGPFTRPDR